MLGAVLLIATLGGETPGSNAASEEPAGLEAAAELRALRGLLGMQWLAFRQATREVATSPQAPGLDLQLKLGRFLERVDLSPEQKEEAIRLYRAWARSVFRQEEACAAARSESDPREGKSAPAAPAGKGDLAHRALVVRELFADLTWRAEEAGADTVPIELELLAHPAAALDAHEAYRVVARIIPKLQERRGTLSPSEVGVFLGEIRRLLSTPAWPELDEGVALAGVLEQFMAFRGEVSADESALIGAKLAEWTARLIRAETEREGELAQGTAIIHLYRSLEIAGRHLDPACRAAAVEGLQPLVEPALVSAAAAGPPPSEGLLKAVELGEVRLAVGPAVGGGGGQKIPPLASSLFPEMASRYLLVPRKSYQVELVATGANRGARSIYWVLARAGNEARLQLPRVVPPGMVPVTAADSGRITFLADRQSWSNRRFLLACQRSWNSLGADRGLAARIHRHTSLREVPLEGGGAPTFEALVNLLGSPAAREAIESGFWVDTGTEAGRKVAFEIASAVLSGNTGLKDTALSLPTVAEANRLWREADRFAIAAAEPRPGLVSPSRLVPEPKDPGDPSRHALRTVLRLVAP